MTKCPDVFAKGSPGRLKGCDSCLRVPGGNTVDFPSVSISCFPPPRKAVTGRVTLWLGVVIAQGTVGVT